MKCRFWLKIKNRLFGKGKKKTKTEKEKTQKEKDKKEKVMESAAIVPEIKKAPRPSEPEESQDYGETIVLSAMSNAGPASFVSREPGELATIYLKEELTVVGKMEHAADAVIDVATVSRIHAKIRKRDDKYYLTDLNSRNGTSVNGRLLRPGEEYELQPEDEVDFAQARYIFLE